MSGACGGDASSPVDFGALQRAICQSAERCECWSAPLRQSCDTWLGEDLRWLQERAAQQAWSFHEACLRREIELYQQLGCRAEVLDAELYAAERDLGCKYFTGSVALGGPCTSLFDCEGDALCGLERGVCQAPDLTGTAGEACIEQAACDGRGSLFCDPFDGELGTCKPPAKQGKDCALGQLPGPNARPIVLCEAGSHCDASSLRCEASPRDGEHCAPVFGSSAVVCAPGHRCALETGTPTCLRLPLEGESCTRFCADGFRCASRSDEGACGDRSDCHCTAELREPGTALTCSFSDEDSVGLIEFRGTMPLSRRELARLLRLMP